MSYLARFSPVRAISDLRQFLAARTRFDLIFLLAAFTVTSTVIIAFVRDSRVEVPYHRDIIYVQQWRADRSEAEIKAQQVIDQAAKVKAEAEFAARREKNRQAFQRIDNQLTQWGF